MQRKLLFTTLILSFLMSTMAFGQSKQELNKIIKQTNVKQLNILSKKFFEKQKEQKQKALKLAKEKGWPITIETKNGFMELQGVRKNGKPLYYITHNANAAITVSTDKVHPGGSLGLNLDGTGMTAGEWDGGDVLTTHQEFNNTGSCRVTDKDGVGTTHEHATHVAGTIIAGGVDANAKGMAYNASLDAYDWNSDESEMATAAANGLLISNHSYGYSAGWTYDGSSWSWSGNTSISNDEDFEFGFYSSYCADIDNVALNAPYYLIVKSAGNDLGDWDGSSTLHPKDGGADGFDCISYKGNAKDILTVGAVMDIPGGYTQPSDVTLTSFSSTGPCDDGRIKPDICGNGYELYSANNTGDDQYQTMSGTSMSSPNVTGSLLLLQEHYHNLNSAYMKAATLKALVIHTADECGTSEGPDYKFGWGLLNTASAANLISNNNISTYIKEENLTDGGSYVLHVSAKGTEPLVATIVWADPAGTPVADQLDPTDIMLVNDLDLKIDDGTTTYYPYKLDGANPSNAATKGVNNVDNVEKVYIASPTTGDYTITVNHKNSLSGGNQNFSIIISGISNGYPIVQTNAASGITTSSATLNGEVISDNGSSVTERGFIYNTSGNPTFSDSKVTSGTGTGTFSKTISGLTQGETYYYKSYATNSTGTDYGVEQSFTTLCGSYTLPFTEDFSKGELPNCWENNDNATGGVWKFDNPGSRTFNSTTHSNGFAIFDSDNASNDSKAEDADLVTPTIDCSGMSIVRLAFETYFKSGYSGKGEVFASNDDGSTWTSITSYSASTTDNAKSEDIDISTIAANKSQVKIKWKWTGDYSWYWAIDDIKVYEQKSNDLSVTSVSPTFSFPDDSNTPEVVIKNIGTSAQSSYQVTVTINDGSSDVYSSTSNVTTSLASEATTTITMADSWTATPTGDYTIKAIVKLTGDEDLTNDTIAETLSVVNFTYPDKGKIYAYDAYSPSAGLASKFVSIDKTTGNLTGLATSNTTDIITCGDYVDGVIAGVESTTNNIYLMNHDGSNYKLGELSGVTNIYGLAYDESSDKIYASDYDGTNSILITIDKDNLSVTTIGTIVSGTIVGIASDGHGNLYGINLTDNKLYSINTTTGTGTAIGSLGLTLQYQQDIGFDRGTGILYGALYTTDGGLYSINTTTGATTLIKSFTDEVTMCAIIPTPITATLSGNWSTINPLPTKLTDVIIPDGISITVPSAKATENCFDLTINAGGILTIDGTLNINNNLNIEAQSSKTGSLINLGTLNINNQSNIQQYLSSTSQTYNWHYVSAPLSDATTNVFPGVTHGVGSVYASNWDEVSGTWNNIDNTSAPLGIVKGYAVPTNSATTIEYTGTGFISGNQSASGLTYTGANSTAGFNLVGNPFTAAIDASKLTGTNWTQDIWVRNDGNFEAYNVAGATGTLSGGIIPALQGFWVKVNSGGGSVDINTSSLVSNTNAIYKSNNNIELTISNNNYNDKTIVYFNYSAKNDFDIYDTEKRFTENNDYPQIFSLINNKSFAINGIKPLDNNQVTIPIGYKSNTQQELTITANNLTELDDAYHIYLNDKKLNKVIDLQKTSSYTFNSENRNIIERFDLIISKSATFAENAKTDFNVFTNNKTIYIETQINNKYSITIYNTIGQTVYNNSKNLTKGLNSFIFNNKSGIYFINISSNNESKTNKIIIK